MELTLQYIKKVRFNKESICHNPCFYGINFAIFYSSYDCYGVDKPQSLFLWN